MHVHIKRKELVAVKILTNVVKVKYNRMLQSHILHNLLASLGVVFVVILYTCASPLPRFLLADARREKKSLELRIVSRCSLRKNLCHVNSSSISHVLCHLFCQISIVFSPPSQTCLSNNSSPGMPILCCVDIG